MLDFWRRWRSKGRVNRRLSWVAEVVDEREELQRRVKAAASEFSVADLTILTTLLLAEVKAPRHLSDRFPEYGSWLAARQTAAYEIFSASEDRGVTPLIGLMKGSEALDQGFAVDLLGHLASRGICADEISWYLRKALTECSTNTLVEGADGMAQWAAQSPPFASALLALIDKWAAAEERLDYLVLLESLCDEAPEVARMRSGLLLEIMRSKGRGQSGSIWPEGVAAPDKEEPKLADLDSIIAATALLKLDPNHEEVKEALQVWMREHPDSSIREEIAHLLAR